MALARPLSATRHHVNHVLVMGPDPKMGRIAASPIIATVQDEKIFRNGAINQYINQTVSTPQLLVDFDLTISPRRNRTLPLPTSIGATGLIDVSPSIFRFKPFRFVIARLRTELSSALSDARSIRLDGIAAYRTDNVWGKIRAHLLTSSIGRWMPCPGLLTQRRGFCVPSILPCRGMP
jgi:hypothetical protein